MRDADKRMYYIVSPQSFAYNPARINVGSIGYQNTSKNVIVSSLYEVFKTTDNVDDRFLWHWFKSDDFQKLIVQLQEGGVRLYFYYDKLCMGSIALPCLKEQRQIGMYLDKLDNLITLQQCKAQKKNPAQSSGFSLETPYSTAYSSTFLTLGSVAVFLSSHGNVAFINTQNSIRTIITRITPFTMILTTLFPM